MNYSDNEDQKQNDLALITKLLDNWNTLNLNPELHAAGIRILESSKILIESQNLDYAITCLGMAFGNLSNYADTIHNDNE